MDITAEVNNRKKVALLSSIRQDLFQFTQHVVIENQDLDIHAINALSTSFAFNDYNWQNSTLFRRIKRLQPVEEDFLRFQLAQAEEKLWIEFDKDLQEAREKIGAEWAMLQLATLFSDDPLVKTLYLAAFRHIFTEFPLRLRRPPGFIPGRQPALDLGPQSEPLRWKLSWLSIYWVYAAFVVYLINQISINHDSGDARNRQHLRQLRVSFRATVKFIEARAGSITPGDLVLADALISALLRPNSRLNWEGSGEAMYLAKLSPISRICRLERLLGSSADENNLRLGLTRKSKTDTQLSIEAPELSILASTDQLPGVHHRLAQHLSYACQPDLPEIFLEEAANTFYTLAQDNFENYRSLLYSKSSPEDGMFQLGSLILSTYRLAWQDGTLQDALRRQENFGAPMKDVPLLKELWEKSKRPVSPVGFGQRFWLDRKNREFYSRLREMAW